MSMFTPWNGPQGTGISTKDLLALIGAYNTLSSELHEHINKTVGFSEATEEGGVTYTGFVHGVKEVLDKFYAKLTNKAEQSDLSQVTTKLNAYADKTDALEHASDEHAVGLSSLVSKTDALERASDEHAEGIAQHTVSIQELDALTERLDASVNALNELAELLSAEGMTDAEGNTVAEFNNVVSSANHLLGMLHAKKVIDFTAWHTVAMQYAGTGTQIDTATGGVFIIGRLSTDWSDDDDAIAEPKSGRAYIKYVNSHPFDAIVDMTATKGDDGFTGNLQAVVSKSDSHWQDIRFHLVHATSTKGEDAVYLGFSAKNFASETSATHSKLSVRVAGVNFIPLGADGAPFVNTVIDSVNYTTKMPENKLSATLTTTVAMEAMAINGIVDEDGANLFRVKPSDVEGKYMLFGDEALQYIHFLSWPVVVVEEEQPDGSKIPVKRAFATDADVRRLASTPLGGIIQWPSFEEVVDGATGIVTMRRATNVPDGWLATDGSVIYIGDEYAELEETGLLPYADDAHLYLTLPLQDFSIMKAKVAKPETIMPAPSEYIDIDVVNRKVEQLKKDVLENEINRDRLDANQQEQIEGREPSGLLTRIENEENRAQDAEGVLQGNLEAETDRAKEAENMLNAAVEAEHDSRVAVDNLHGAQLAGTEESGLRTRIESEENRAQDAEGVLQGNIDAEEARALTEEARVTHALADEVTRSTAAEETLGNRIDAEEARAKREEKRIEDERIAATDNLHDALEGEKTRAVASESNIMGALVAAKNTLTERIATEEETRRSVDTDIVNYLSTMKVYTKAEDLPNITPDAGGNEWHTGDKAVVFDGVNLRVYVATVNGTLVSWS